MATTKRYFMISTRTSYRGNQSETKSFYEGTIEELTKVFSYTLECGRSYNSKINCHPTTMVSLLNNIRKSCDETEGSCYRRTSVEAVSEETWKQEKEKYENR